MIIELCCAICYYLKLHSGHKIVKVDEEEALKKEKLEIDSCYKDFLKYVEKINELKQTIENEMVEINKVYDNIFNEITKEYEIRHEKLLKEENDLKEKLQNEVTKIKESLEIYFTESNELIKTNDKISKGVKTLESEKDKSILKTLSYISNINKNKKEIKNLLGKLMKNLKIFYEKEKNRIKYEINYFNGIQIPTKVEINNITLNSCQISWDIEDISLKNAKNKNMEFIIEIRQKDDDDKFKQVYKGNNKNYSLQNLLSNQEYEVRICSVIDDLCGEWSNIISFDTSKSQSKILGKTKKEKKFLKQIYEWTGLNKIELLYRRSEDGKSSKTFHDKCDNKGPTLCLYENTDGYILEDMRQYLGLTKEMDILHLIALVLLSQIFMD